MDETDRGPRVTKLIEIPERKDGTFPEYFILAFQNGRYEKFYIRTQIRSHEAYIRLNYP